MIFKEKVEIVATSHYRGVFLAAVLCIRCTLLKWNLFFESYKTYSISIIRHAKQMSRHANNDYANKNQQAQK